MSEEKKKKVECKWDGTGESFCKSLTEGKEVTDMECVFCMTEGFKRLGTGFMIMIAEMGAGELAQEFLAGVLKLWVTGKMLNNFTKERLPEFYKEGKKDMNVRVLNMKELIEKMRKGGRGMIA